MRSSLPPASIALALAGCTVGPDYQRPTMTAPASFVGQAAVVARPVTTRPIDATDWWEGFQDPLLSKLIRSALEQNLDIAQASARVLQSRAALRSANAALLPSGNVGVQAAHAHSSLESPTGRLLDAVPGFDRDAQFYEANVGASWELDLFGGNRRGQQAALAEWQGSKAGVAATRLAVAAQTADTYMTIRGLQTRLDVAHEQVTTQRHLVDIVDLQYRKGVAAELQVRQARGSLAQVEASVPVLDNALTEAMNALDVLLGTQPGSHSAEFSVAAAVPDAPAVSGAGGPAALLRRRPDIFIAERRLAASNARIGQAIAEYYPKLSLSGLLGTATTAFGGLFSGGANQAQGVAGLRWRLFDFGRVDAEIAAARGRNVEDLAAYRLTVLRASEDVENAFSALVRREAQERLLAAGEVDLDRAKQSSLAAYKGGVVSLIEVLDADTRLLAVRDARAQARTEAARAAIASYRALGGGWNENDGAPS